MYRAYRMEPVDMKVALFQFAVNAAGKIPAVMENLLGVFLINALNKAANLEVIDLTPPPREGEILSLAGLPEVDEIREAAEKVGARWALWGSLRFGPPDSPLVREMAVELRVGCVEGDHAPARLDFQFRGLQGDVRTAHLSVDVGALEDLVEEMTLALADEMDLDRDSLRLSRIGEGLSLSDRAMVYFVYALRILSDPEAKLKLYRKAVSADPSFAQAYINAGQLLLGLGRYGEAMRLLLRAESRLKGSEAEPDVLNLLGVSAINMGMWEEAVGIWRRSLELRPRSVETLCNLAQALAMRGMNREAEEHYRRALDADPESPLPWLSLGRLLVQEGNHQEAEKAVRRYIELCPGDPWAYYLLGVCQMEAGNREEARFSLAKALQLDPKGRVGELARRRLED
ncbi:MAG: tetratricopeptide repeat protein [Actinomycetota bacterium]|nr:tetratricopeptide repeat protein [Actinomycetota bacterium]